MYLKKIGGPRAVTLPDGTHMTRADLPPCDTIRWVASRKAAVLKGIACGLISDSEAMALYGLSESELDAWKTAVLQNGESALKATKLRYYRQP